MKIRNPWLRSVLWCGVGISVALLTAMAVCLAILMRKPLSAEYVETATGVESIASTAMVEPAGKIRFDPGNPPRSMREFVELTMRETSGEAARLYLDLLREFEAENYGPQWDELTEGYSSWMVDQRISTEGLAWVVARKDFVDRFNEMMAAGGPPVMSIEQLVALRKVVVGTPSEHQMMRFGRDLNFVRLKAAVDGGNTEEAVDALLPLIDQALHFQKVSGLMVALVAVVNLEKSIEIFDQELKRSRLSPILAERLLERSSGLRPFNEDAADGLELIYRLRRAQYIDAIDGSPIGAYNHVEALQQWQIWSARGGNYGDPKKSWIKAELESWAFAVKYVSTNLHGTLRLKIHGERSIEELDEHWERMIENFKNDFFKDSSEEFSAPIQSMLSTEQDALASFAKFNQGRMNYWVRFLLFRSALRELAGTTEGDQTIDPFSGGPFLRREDGEFVELRSAGPDKVDDGGEGDDEAIRFRIRGEEAL